MDLNTYRFGLVLFEITILFSNSGARNVTSQISHMSISIVLDVGQISEDYLQNQNPIYYKLKSYIEIISKRNVGNYSSSQFLLHFKISNQVLNHYKITSIGNMHKPIINMSFSIYRLGLDNESVHEFEKFMKVVNFIQQENKYFRPSVILTIK